MLDPFPIVICDTILSRIHPEPWRLSHKPLTDKYVGIIMTVIIPIYTTCRVFTSRQTICATGSVVAVKSTEARRKLRASANVLGSHPSRNTKIGHPDSSSYPGNLLTVLISSFSSPPLFARPTTQKTSISRSPITLHPPTLKCPSFLPYCLKKSLKTHACAR